MYSAYHFQMYRAYQNDLYRPYQFEMYHPIFNQCQRGRGKIRKVAYGLTIRKVIGISIKPSDLDFTRIDGLFFFICVLVL